MYEDNDMYDNDPNVDYSRGQNCIPQETVIRNVRLAAAYVPFQKMCNILPPIEGLKRGTIFIELYSPYGRKKRDENYID
ncbi:hypothetical protein BJV85_002658 [Clostridium acetobutylicum]|uniref:Spore coat associated protein JA (CotJA) n=1 Tax=Clostridium acetobutylicum (strain ATCC 824 / DSM 792 / JCM 1419 / IAM 19013 / LMG 5710 / NBRC 13948 / NRRL B-527 / VKM B-1787 / 2291 / W) TaxID=272562 RepID=Q97JF0_CLOAB|nr:MULTISPECIES: spore coat associated protein CotJA [Clostridium]AAK79304.1 Hypothetical protein CA_C1336 [Clostridium acetobutylicum ATCC 824]ADZ20387.1 Conserved hypothetical protein [Clostridium acetobutylicum EA 2018]AEI31774.1 hypothetical protein SMB_G1359 [Clostridium acetobutylicum DSM 1731]AWV81445.1 spore coat associated protein CotJA [Clostridium acetobutylicum]KHD36082.1 hypothetical protein NL50_09880 [Clostridium acetobutylicum]